jgi:hypothetical protein
MTKKKKIGQTMIYKTKQNKTKRIQINIEQHEPHSNLGGGGGGTHV